MWTGYYPLDGVKHDTSRLCSTNRYFRKLTFTFVRPSHKFIICFTVQPIDWYIHYVMSKEAYKYVYKWGDLVQNWYIVTIEPIEDKHIFWSKADYPEGSNRGGQMMCVKATRFCSKWHLTHQINTIYIMNLISRPHIESMEIKCVQLRNFSSDLMYMFLVYQTSLSLMITYIS